MSIELTIENNDKLTNKLHNARYIHRLTILLTVVFFIFACVDFILFITHGVREFVQHNYFINFYICISAVLCRFAALHFRDKYYLFVLISFAYIFLVLLFFVSISMFLNTEVVYLSFFIISCQCFIYYLISFQEKLKLSSLKLFTVSIILTISFCFVLEFVLAIYNFPFIYVTILTTCFLTYIYFSINYNVKCNYSGDIFYGVSAIFIDYPFVNK